MHFLRKLVREIHRRSVWQVIGIYLVGSWGVLQVVDYMTAFAGLPEWTPSMAFVLLLIGLPITVATAFIQQGIPGLTDDPNDLIDPNELEGLSPEEVHRNPDVHPLARAGMFTWRNAILGGLGAGVLLLASVSAYLVMWTFGIGPVGSLVAQGILDERDPIILAEFENRTDDESLGAVVTDALRVDLLESRMVTVVDGQLVDEVLQRMGRPTDEPLTAEVAREVAVREGIKAVVAGDVSRVGSGYLLAARIVVPGDGTTLAAFRENAEGEDDLLSAIDRLSQRLREKAGESLRDIRAGAPLEAVTTSSLEALRLFVRAEEAGEEGDFAGSMALLQEAVALDSTFAMAWRKLAVAMQDAGGTRDEEMAAATRAFELRHRLTERERYQTIAYYHQVVTLDVQELIRAYRSILDRYPDDRNALNNLSIVYSDLTRWDEAIALLKRAVGGPGRSAPAHTNLVIYQALSGDFQGGEEALTEVKARYPDRTLWNTFIEYTLAYSQGDVDRAIQMAAHMETLPGAPAAWRSSGVRMSGGAAALAGWAAENRGHYQRAIRNSRAEQRWSSAVAASLGLAETEGLLGTGRAAAVLREMLSRGDLAELSGPARDYGSVVSQLAFSGMAEEARRLLDEWSVEGGATAGGTNYESIRDMVGAVLLGFEDPGAGADALMVLRTRLDCPRCWTWKIGDLLTEAGRTEEAIVERERSLQVAEDFWFGLHRVLAHEKLGQLYESQGDTSRAAEHYAAFAEAWADADAELQARVREARAKADALGDEQP